MLHPFSGLKWVGRMQLGYRHDAQKVIAWIFGRGRGHVPCSGPTGRGNRRQKRIYITAWCHKPGNCNLNTHCHESWKLNLKSTTRRLAHFRSQVKYGVFADITREVTESLAGWTERKKVLTTVRTTKCTETEAMSSQHVNEEYKVKQSLCLIAITWRCMHSWREPLCIINFIFG
jgi:hypothetical protein